MSPSRSSIAEIYAPQIIPNYSGTHCSHSDSEQEARFKAALGGKASGALRRASTPLIGPNYLPEGAEDDRRRVGEL
jgi:hypothetical protein